MAEKVLKHLIKSERISHTIQDEREFMSLKSCRKLILKQIPKFVDSMAINVQTTSDIRENCTVLLHCLSKGILSAFWRQFLFL